MFKLGVDAVAVPAVAGFLAGRDRAGCCCLCWFGKKEEEEAEGEEMVVADEAMVGSLPFLFFCFFGAREVGIYSLRRDS